MKVKRRKRISLQRGRPTPATGPKQQRRMDFVHDQMLDGRVFRVLKGGRPSISPEKLMRAMLIQVLYSVRSERQLVVLSSMQS